MTVIQVMRFRSDAVENRKVKKQHGISLQEAQEIFDQVYVLDQKCDDPEQYRSIGWCTGNVCSVIFEIRRDREGEYYHLITAWKSSEREIESYVQNI